MITKRAKIFTFLFILFPLIAHSEAWVSPIDKKYQARNPGLFAEVLRARDILDKWQGRGERPSDAAELLVKVLQKDADFAPAYREFGRAFIMDGHINYRNFKEGSLDSSETAILKSIEIEPDYADSYVLLGHLYTTMKRYEDAENALKKAEIIGTEIPWLDLNWSDLLIRQKRYQEALDRYQEILERYKVAPGPDAAASERKAYMAALNGVTNAYLYMGQYDKVDEGYKKELAYNPDGAWQWGNYAEFLLFKYSDVDGAIKAGEKALSIMDYGMGRFLLACAYYTKWAYVHEEFNPSKKDELQGYFDKAWGLYPYPVKVIKKTRRHTYTQLTSSVLYHWVLEHPVESGITRQELNREISRDNAELNGVSKESMGIK